MALSLPKFDYVTVKTLEEAIAKLNENKGKAVLVAGGIDVLRLLKDRVLPPEGTALYRVGTPFNPQILIDLKGIPGLEYIKEEGGMLKIGALTKIADVAKSSIVKSKYVALADAARNCAKPEIRNAATVAGNLCQEVHCWYFRYPHHVGGRIKCLRKGGDLCYSSVGDNRYHSIFGGPDGCYAPHSSDLAPVLIAFGASVVTTKKTIPLENFYNTKMPITVLEPDEIVKEIQVPTPTSGTKSAYQKVAMRKAVAFPIVNVGCTLTVEGGVVKDARIVLGRVFPKPWRSTAAEDAIKGKAIDDANAEAAGVAAVAKAVPLTNNDYKKQIAKTLVKRAILACK